MRSSKHLIIIICFLFINNILSVQAEIVVPPNTTTAFIQTTGPNGALGVGDYRANAGGDNQAHEIIVNVACTPGETYVFQLFDPAVDAAGNPPGTPGGGPPATGLDGVTLKVRDEIRPNAAPVADNTTFQLESPGGAIVANTTYNPGDFDQDWVTLSAVGPITGPLGTDCGQYILRVTTAVDDENAWRFRLLGGGVPETFDPADGPDNIPGTGDESWIGFQFVSYQHDPSGCQNFYWFSNNGDTNMFMLNFDVDNFGGPPNPPVQYTTPSGVNITGTTSGGTVWNDAAPQQGARPAFANMNTFDAVGDLAGDAIPNPEPGLWSSRLCVNTDNQYSFEVPGKIIFPVPPPLPVVEIDKDDGRVLVQSPSTTTYTLEIVNTGPGAAMPLPAGQFEIIDQMPPELTYLGPCVVNPPLVGVCGPGAGNTINIDLDSQSATTFAYLPGTAAAPDNRGTVTVVVDIAAGLPDGFDIINPSEVDWTDIFANDYDPDLDDDIDTVRLRAAVRGTDNDDDDDDPAATPVPPTPVLCPLGTATPNGFCPPEALGVTQLPQTGQSVWSSRRLPLMVLFVSLGVLGIVVWRWSVKHKPGA